ncbi:hypothetical protein ACFLXJ_03400 [Chloroflexota bacterium]
MEKKEVEIGNPVMIAGVTMIPAIKSSLTYWRHKRNISFLGMKQPFGIIMIFSSGKKAFRTNGEEVSLDQLKQEVPDIKEVLDRI